MKTSKYLWALILYRPWLYLADVVAWALVHLSPAFPGLVTREFFNALSGRSTWALTAWQALLALGLVTLFRVVVIAMGAAADIPHRFSMSALLRHNLLSQVLRKPGALSVGETHGELISRFRDDVTQAEDSISWTLDALGLILFSGSALVILLGINMPIALMVIPPLVCVVLISGAATKRLQQYREKSREATERVTGFLGEMFGVAQAVKLAGADERFLARLKEMNETRRKLALRDTLMTQIVESTSANVASLGTGLVVIVGAASFRNGTFGVGDFSLFVYYFGFIAWATEFLGRFMAHYTQTGVSFSRMAMLMPEGRQMDLVMHNPIYLCGPYPVPEKQEALEPLEVLSVQGLTYSHGEGGRGISDVTFDVRRGTLTVVAGRVGSGKSTLIKTILGLLPKACGGVYWNGRLITDPGTFLVPPRCSYTPQVPSLFSASIRENILLGMERTEDEIAEAIRLSVLEDDISGMDSGLETRVGTGGVRLSGGQMQRLAAARMFVRKPELLLFDDLSSALDVNTERTMWHRIFARESATCLVVSHRRAVLERADNIVLLSEGRVLAQGRLAELHAQYPEMRELLESHGNSGDQHATATA